MDHTPTMTIELSPLQACKPTFCNMLNHTCLSIILHHSCNHFRLFKLLTIDDYLNLHQCHLNITNQIFSLNRTEFFNATSVSAEINKKKKRQRKKLLRMLLAQGAVNSEVGVTPKREGNIITIVKLLLLVLVKWLATIL